jgi:hypothetical protein
MTCTMRNWEFKSPARTSFRRIAPTSATSATDQQQPETGPELVLQPIPELLVPTTNARDESPMRRRQDATETALAAQQQKLQPLAVPISTIVRVESKSDTSSSAQTNSTSQFYVTTLTRGYLEFAFMNANGHDILLAFLQAFVAPERILIQSTLLNTKKNSNNHPGLLQTSSSVSCLDMDGLTSQHLQHDETWPEKLSRRISKVVHSLTELSGAFCDATSCCSEERREQTTNGTNTSNAYGSLEIDENDSQVKSSLVDGHSKNGQPYIHTQRSVSTSVDEAEVQAR